MKFSDVTADVEIGEIPPDRLARGAKAFGQVLDRDFASRLAAGLIVYPFMVAGACSNCRSKETGCCSSMPVTCLV
jgi:hypothetical protein